MIKKRYVLFSGGYDSTHVLYNECKNSTPNNPVIALSVDHHNQSDTQRSAERIYREKIIKELQKKYFVKQETITMRSSMLTSSGKWCQQYWWVISALNYVESDSRVLFGYHMHDEFWKFKHHLHKLLDMTNEIFGKKVSFEYPLEFIYKRQIIQDLMEKSFYKYIWTCDDPIENKDKTLDQCGKCDKCLAIKTALYDIKLRKSKNKKEIEEKPKIIHKLTYYRCSDKMRYLCNQAVLPTEGKFSTNWKDVTCKRCLKLKDE